MFYPPADCASATLMVCIRENTVMAFVEGLLAPAAAAQIEAHASSCPACRRLLSELAEGFSRLEPARRSPDPEETEGPRAAGAVPAPRDDLDRGALVGRYVVLETLGSGGMGIVYAAYDPELDRKVALKLLRTEVLGRSRELRARMTREAQALARLSHPNVVAVHDVGTFGGSVFLAMEFIDGATLGEWLAQRERSWRAVVDTFTMAGRGLAAAHAAGFVHRDFKPANVLVGKDGRARVVDFGLARADAAPGEGGAPPEEAEGPPRAGELLHALTQTGAVVGTPAYMAPEQFERGEVDARADQFSFCVALFEALHRRRPFTVNTCETIAAEAPKGKLRWKDGSPAVPAFIGRALERGLSLSPDDRFPSMDALLAALSSDPRRAWRARAVGALAVGAAGLGVFGALRMSEPPAPLCQGGPAKFAEAWSEAKQRAIRERFLGTGLPYAEHTWAEVSRAIDAYGRSWSAMHTEACEATRVRGEQSDEALSLRMLCLDRRLAEVSALTDVLAAADAKATTKAVDAAGGLLSLSICANVEALRTPVRAPEGEEEAAAARAIQGTLAEAKARSQLAQYKEAQEIASKAVERARALKHAPTEAEALEMEGAIRLGAVDPKAAEQSLREGFAAATAGRHDRIAARAAIELVFVVGSQMFRFDEAGEWAFHARAALRRWGDDPELAGQMHANIGSLLYNKGDFRGAKAEYEASLAVREQAFGPEHRHVAQSLELLAMATEAHGDFTEASVLQRRSADITRRLFGDKHPAYGESLKRVGGVLTNQDRGAEAVAVLEEALSVIEAARGREHPHVGTILLTLGRAKHKVVRYGEALDAANRALAIFKATPRAEPFVADSFALMGDVQRDQGKLDEALATHQKALALREEVFGPEHEQVGASLEALGAVLLRQGKAKEGLDRYSRALSVWEKANGKGFIDNAFALTGMGEAHLMQGEPAPAIPLLERAISLIEEHRSTPKLHAEARLQLARALWDAGKERDRARSLAAEAEKGFLALASDKDVERARAWLKGRGGP